MRGEGGGVVNENKDDVIFGLILNKLGIFSYQSQCDVSNVEKSNHLYFIERFLSSIIYIYIHHNTYSLYLTLFTKAI